MSKPSSNESTRVTREAMRMKQDTEKEREDEKNRLQEAKRTANAASP